MADNDTEYKRELLAKIKAMSGDELEQFRKESHERFEATCQEIMNKIEKLKELNKSC